MAKFETVGFDSVAVPVRTASDQPYRLQKFRLRLFYASDIRQPNLEVNQGMFVWNSRKWSEKEQKTFTFFFFFLRQLLHFLAIKRRLQNDHHLRFIISYLNFSSNQIVWRFRLLRFLIVLLKYYFETFRAHSPKKIKNFFTWNSHDFKLLIVYICTRS